MNYLKIRLYCWRSLQYVNFVLKAQTKWSIHSPFVYELTTKVFPNQSIAFGDIIDQIRKDYLTTHEYLLIEDYGAGYDNQKQLLVRKKLSEVTKSSARKKAEGELLYRLIKFHKPKNFLELGTNLGFSTAYISYGLQEIYGKDFEFTTVEGANSLYLYAQQLFQKLNLKATFHHDNFDHFLETNIHKKWDGVFLDGNHTFASTIRYFHILKNQINQGGIMILDDIYWSPEMQKAWKHIIQDPKVKLSIDIFHLGIIYIEKNQAKEHFRIWY